MDRRTFLKTSLAATAALTIPPAGLRAAEEGMAGGKPKMQIKTVKLYENGFISHAFIMGGEEGEDKFDPSIRYRSSLQNFVKMNDRTGQAVLSGSHNNGETRRPRRRRRLRFSSPSQPMIFSKRNMPSSPGAASCGSGWCAQ